MDDDEAIGEKSLEKAECDGGNDWKPEPICATTRTSHFGMRPHALDGSHKGDAWAGSNKTARRYNRHYNSKQSFITFNRRETKRPEREIDPVIERKPMVQIVASDEFTRQLESTEGIVELIDTNGRRLGMITRPPSNEDIRIAIQRRTANNPGITTELLVNRLNATQH